MTIGIISYLSARGLGNMAHDLRVQLGIEHQMVVPDVPWPYQPHWATGKELYLEQWEVQRDDLEMWRDFAGIDTVVAIETGFGANTFRWAKELGMRTVLICMWEAFNPNHPAYQHVDLYICPSYRCYQEIPFENKIYLPYPVSLDEFPYRQRTGPAGLFVHNAGSGGMNGRKGTEIVLAAYDLACVDAQIDLIVRSQRPLEEIVPDFMKYMERRAFRVEGQTENRADLYNEGDVLLYPSKYDGHALVTLEAMAAGMPVITTDADPMNEYWRPGEYPLLVKVDHKERPNGLVNPHCYSMVASIEDLARKMVWCTKSNMACISAGNHDIVEKEHSWSALKDRWLKALKLESR